VASSRWSVSRFQAFMTKASLTETIAIVFTPLSLMA